ncbi:hypothetical protein [Nocardia sp. NPDC059239]|uniref:hypothetical protein n=1 Tax=Nocardia sp. NPDC059239 TaxID=3346785 RepID=UPI00368455B7
MAGIERAHGRVFLEQPISSIASDLPATEVLPRNSADESAPLGFSHRVLLDQLVNFTGELWQLQPLADDCRSYVVYEVFLISAPPNIPNTVGSPANVIVFKSVHHPSDRAHVRSFS